MLQRIIDFSLKNKFIVMLATVALVLGGIYAVRNIPLDAIPDLSDTQVIIYTPWEGQAPNIVEDQVTYPITTKMLSVPRAKVVRGYSFYGYSFVYVIFDDGTDPYWARSRVLEYLSSISGQLPKGVTPSLGPDATGVGWAFMYSINSTNRNLADLRSIQDWYLKYQLTAVPGVSEVASVGGFVKQYQVTVDPTKLRAYNLSLKDVSLAIERSNGEVGGRSLELSEREFILRVKGYIENLDDLKKVAVGVGAERRADSVARRGEHPVRPRHAPRHRRFERRRRNRRRHRRRALRRERLQGDPGREAAAGPGDEGAAAGRESTPSPMTAPR